VRSFTNLCLIFCTLDDLTAAHLFVAIEIHQAGSLLRDPHKHIECLGNIEWLRMNTVLPQGVSCDARTCIWDAINGLAVSHCVLDIDLRTIRADAKGE
jgi:hypothetical protein